MKEAADGVTWGLLLEGGEEPALDGDRLLKSKQSVRLLELYRQVLHQEEDVTADSPESRELLLSGLVVKQQGSLRVNNRIYESIFDRSWLEQHKLLRI